MNTEPRIAGSGLPCCRVLLVISLRMAGSCDQLGAWDALDGAEGVDALVVGAAEAGAAAAIRPWLKMSLRSFGNNAVSNAKGASAHLIRVEVAVAQVVGELFCT